MKKHFYVEIALDDEAMPSVLDVAQALRDIAEHLEHGRHAGRVPSKNGDGMVGLFELRRPTTEPAKW